jgi:hypothetical protein
MKGERRWKKQMRSGSEYGNLKTAFEAPQKRKD